MVDQVGDCLSEAAQKAHYQRFRSCPIGGFILSIRVVIGYERLKVASRVDERSQYVSNFEVGRVENGPS